MFGDHNYNCAGTSASAGAGVGGVSASASADISVSHQLALNVIELIEPITPE